jgi:WD repeat-containing protein 40A
LQQNILHDIRQASLPCILGERDIVHTKDLNKIFASVWISSTQVIFSTKCKNIVVYDTVTGRKTYIPVISKPFDKDAESQSGGIHTIQINPSKTLLATGSMNSHDIVIYSLPHLEPLHYIDAHKDWLFSLQWISDSILSSCSRDKTIALWSISRWSFQQLARTETHSKKVRSIAYNRRHKILSSISADGTFKLWDVNTLGNVRFDISGLGFV